jgi:phospholipase/lecithinase/hemolysin
MVLKNLKTVSFVALLAHAEFVNAGQARRDAVVKKDFEHLVSFGDSYTAEPSTNSTSTSTGGRIWPRMVADAAGAALHDYARSGATCTNDYRSPGNSASSTSILDDELPEFKSAWADANDTVSASLDPSTTVYSIWIGTNDLGYNAFINAGNPPGYNITSVVNCIWTAMDELYALGADYFVLMNTAPLQLSPEYGLPDAGGVGDNEYWALKVPSPSLQHLLYLNLPTCSHNLLTRATRLNRM